MFRNTLTGLSKRQKEVMDQVCIHLNGCLRRMNIHFLDGEEDQILMDLWMDSFPYLEDPTGKVGEWFEKTDKDGNVTRTCYIMNTVREKVYETEPVYEGTEVVRRRDPETKEYVDVEIPKLVGGRTVEKWVEKRVKALDFSRSLMESTSVGIYKWRGEQLLMNKCKYLFGDNRVRAMNEDGSPKTATVIDKYGNARVRAVYEDKLDLDRVNKRDLTMKINESDLARDGEDPITIEDVAGGVEGGFGFSELLTDLTAVCDDTEMIVVNQIMGGESMAQIYRNLEEKGLRWTQGMMNKLREKIQPILKPSVQ